MKYKECIHFDFKPSIFSCIINTGLDDKNWDPGSSTKTLIDQNIVKGPEDIAYATLSYCYS